MMKNKKWYKSKTVWGSIAIMVIGVAQIYYTGGVDPQALVAIAAGFGLYGLRDAIDHKDEYVILG